MIRHLTRAVLVVAFVATGISLSGSAASAAEAGTAAGIAPLAAPALRTTTSTTVRTDLDTGEVVTRTLVSEYNAAGKLVHSLDTDVRESDGWLLGSGEYTATYDAAGRLITAVTIDSLDGDGPLLPTTIVETLTYTNVGYVATVVTTVDAESDGIIESTETESFGTDRRGRVVTAQYVTEGFGETITTNVSTTYDARGNVLATEQVTDIASTPQNPDVRSTDAATYNRKGQVVSSRSFSYSYDESGVEALSSRSTSVLTYDGRGNILTFSAEADGDGDGVAETFTVATHTYNRANKPILQISTSTDPISTTETRLSSTYDARGRLSIEDSLITVNDVPEQARHVTYAYDGKGRLVLSVNEWDDGADGIVDTTDTETQGFDRRGRVISASTTTYDNVADHLLASSQTTAVYTRTTVTTTISFDVDGDGTIDQTIVSTDPL